MRHELGRRVGPSIAQTLLPIRVQSPSATLALVGAARTSNGLATVHVATCGAAESPARVAATADDDLRSAARALENPGSLARQAARPAHLWTRDSEVSDTQSAASRARAMSAEGSGLPFRAFTFCAPQSYARTGVGSRNRRRRDLRAGRASRRNYADWERRQHVPEAKEALSLIAGMYRVEHEAERRGIVGTPAHLTLRRELARPLYVRLLLLARETRRAHAPKTLLGRAARYTWRNQVALGRCLKDARIPLDNNRAENAMRLVALGRKNFLFVHSEEAGKELALLYSLVVSCTRVGVNPVEYVADVLDRLGAITDADELAELLPHRWKPPPKPSEAVDFDT